jgi:hypothetical protein
MIPRMPAPRFPEPRGQVLSARREAGTTADEYQVVGVSGERLGALSLLFFLAALGSRYLVRLLPASLRHYPHGAFYSAVGAPLLSGLGLLVALLALRVSARKTTARLALFLNLVAFLLSSLLLAAFFAILPG